MLELAGRAGHDLQLSLTFDSKQIYLVETWISTWYGYRYGFEPASYLPGPHQGRWVLNVWPSLKEEIAGSLYRFTTPDGAVHKLDQVSAGGWLPSRDGSDLAYHPTSQRVAGPGGDFFDFSEYAANRVVHHTDRNGNRISYHYQSAQGGWRPWKIVDTVGREVELVCDGATWSEITELRLLRPGHSALVWRFEYSRWRRHGTSRSTRFPTTNGITDVCTDCRPPRGC